MLFIKIREEESSYTIGGATQLMLRTITSLRSRESRLIISSSSSGESPEKSDNRMSGSEMNNRNGGVKNNFHSSESISVVDITALPSPPNSQNGVSISETKALIGSNSSGDFKKEESTSPSSSGITSTGLKVLLLLAVQNCSKNLLLRFVMKEHPKFLTSAAILGVESVKLVLSLLYIILVERRPATSAITFMKQDKRNTLLMAVPATLYSIQMTLEYIALSNIDAAVFSVLVQMKLLATAGCAVFILGKRIKKVQLISLVLLTIGVMLCNMKNYGTAPESSDEEEAASMGDSTKGLLATVGIAACSGFASVYTEKVIKAKRSINSGGSSSDQLPSQQHDVVKVQPMKEKYGLAYTQVQLAAVSLVIMGFYCAVAEMEQILEKGLWYGFNGPAVISILVSAIGGLIVAAGKLEYASCM